MGPAKIFAAAIVVVTVAACANDPNSPRQDSGAVAGAIAGGTLGAVLGGRGTGSRVAGAVIGAAAGGLLGSAIGASLDERDRQEAYAAEMRALESGPPGASVGWRSQHTGYYGSVVPGPYYESRGMRCRQYIHTVYINGQPQIARGTACRDPDGAWVAVS